MSLTDAGVSREVRRCAHKRHSRSFRGQPSITRIDHAVWQVADINRCIEVLVERLGFPLLRPCIETSDLRVAEVEFGGMSVRLVENRLRHDPAFSGNLMVVAFETSTPLAEAAAVLRARGFSTSEIHRAADRLTGGSGKQSPEFDFTLVRGVAQFDQASLTAAVVLMQWIRQSGQERHYLLFAQSTARHVGVIGVESLTAEVEDESGVDRWRRFLSLSGPAKFEPSKLQAGPSLQVIPGSKDGFSSLTIGCHNLASVMRNVASCELAGFYCQGEFLLDPLDTGGIALRFVDVTKKTRP